MIEAQKPGGSRRHRLRTVKQRQPGGERSARGCRATAVSSRWIACVSRCFWLSTQCMCGPGLTPGSPPNGQRREDSRRNGDATSASYAQGKIKQCQYWKYNRTSPSHPNTLGLCSSWILLRTRFRFLCKSMFVYSSCLLFRSGIRQITCNTFQIQWNMVRRWKSIFNWNIITSVWKDLLFTMPKEL